MVTKHQRETDFLRQLLQDGESAERDKLEERITRIQRDEHCVRRAVWLMALLSAVAMAGIYYAPVFLADFPENKWHFLINVVCGLGLASLISFVAFVGYWLAHRGELDRRREECRQLIIVFLESRLGRAHAVPLSRRAKEDEIIIHRGEIAVPAPEIMKLPEAYGTRQQ